ncbi:hypothetical protein [Nocardiopsis sp. CC223A]|uniref:hypothetical protein n=1 Tax=Nocardiopsis sp. CC223A TaxID=3044051 RepID=UPI00278C04D5|nr:hypothetical protein [Nocardiopsis sp. CC223A]
MSEQPVAWDSDEPTIRRPEQTPAALRDALTRIAPRRRPISTAGFERPALGP